ncbi:IS110 family transposase, partial [Domibacillus sp. 8LH]
LRSFTVSNDLPGATKLRDAIIECAAGRDIYTLRIGLESTSVYSFHPSMFLHNDASLKSLGTEVFVMNPKQIANFKKSY